MKGKKQKSGQLNGDIPAEESTGGVTKASLKGKEKEKEKKRLKAAARDAEGASTTIGGKVDRGKNKKRDKKKSFSAVDVDIDTSAAVAVPTVPVGGNEVGDKIVSVPETSSFSKGELQDAVVPEN